ncbi:MAG: hypothetical protein IJJ25_04625 [Lachnospiraceae bacterium]|nr:hypothetical protein [Lachnospiraceae bacterium]
MKKRLFVWFLLSITVLTLLSGHAVKGAETAPEESFEQKYAQERLSLADANRYQTDVTLSEDEKQLDERLAEWKAEYIASCNGSVPDKMSVISDETIWSSALYAFCKSLPKGADLHIHSETLLPFDEVLAFVESRDELYIGTGQENRYILFCHESPGDAGEDELPVKEALMQGVIGREELKKQWTILGGEQYEDIWEWFELLFDKEEAMSATPALLEAYYKEAFRYCCRNNILHVEIRKVFSGSHEKAAAKAQAIRNAYYEVKKEYPGFIVSLVGAGLKRADLDRELTDVRLDNAVYIHEHVRDESDPEHIHDFLIGIDLVNEEDRSRPLIEFADQLDGIVKEHPRLNLLLHAGESLEASSDNVIDAYLLGAKRIGHGMNLYRFPDLMDLIREDDICLEICPVSNQTLRYVSDLRSHPAAEYLKRGVPFCLCSDDPVYQEHTMLTDDFFAAIVCWDLSLAEIKQLCMNSITYCCADDFQKEELMNNWEKQWEEFLSFGE